MTTPPLTAEQLLTRHGLSVDRLMRIVRRGITDQLGAGYLPPADFEDLHQKCLEAAISLAYNHDSAIGSLSYATRVYRMTRFRTIDCIRRERIPEARRRGELEQEPEDGIRIDQETFEQLVENVGPALTTCALHTLHTVGRSLLVDGDPRWKIANEHHVDPSEITELLEEVGRQLTATLKENT